MKKATPSRRIRIVGASVLIALLLSAVVLPAALLASPAINVSGGGTMTFAYDDGTDAPVPDHDQASLEEQSKVLGGENNNDPGCGFKVNIVDGGLAVLSPGLGGSNDRIHDNLVKAGILSYAKYENSLCENLNNLIVILDFSSFYVTRFQASTFDSLSYALLGGAWDFQSYSVSVPVFDSTTGKQSRTAAATFGGSSISVDGQTISSGGISLRIVLPNLGTDKALVFDDYCLNFYNWGNQGSLAPQNVSLDISNMSISPTITADGRLDLSGEPFSGLEIGKKLTYNNWLDNNQYGCSHLHFIGRTANQLEYALYASIEHTQANADTSMEIFVKKQQAEAAADSENDFIFTRMYSRITRSEGKSVIDVIDDTVYTQGAALSQSDLTAILEIGYWLHFRRGHTLQEISDAFLLFHQRRTAANALDDDKASLTIGLQTSVLSGVSVYPMYCKHNADTEEETPDGLIGFFGAGRIYFKADGAQLSSAFVAD